MKIMIISILILFLSTPLFADDSTFCEAKGLENFESMARKYPEDISLQILHALKIGLCTKIEQNSISIPEAINLFNDMVDTVANKRGEIEEQEKVEDL